MHTVSSSKIFNRIKNLEMIKSKIETLTKSIPHFSLWPCLFLLVLVSYTLHYNNLGFTEDDFYQITPFLDGFSDFTVDTLTSYFIDPIQGRPIGYSVPLLMSALSASLGGKFFLAFASSTVFFLMFITAYKIFFHLFNNTFSAITGALFLVFFPSDTTHTFWVHAFQLHTSLLFVLIGIWFLIRKKKFLPYILLGLSLLTYESTISVFFIFPILLKYSKKEWLLHITKSIILVTTILISRVLIMSDSSRIQFVSEDLARAAKHIFYSLVVGSYTSISSSIEPITTIFNDWLWNWQEIGVVIPILVLFLVTLIFHSKFEIYIETGKKIPIKKLFLGSIILVIGSYITSMTHYPGFRGGRFTSVHLTASLGVALLITTLFTSIYFRIKNGRSLNIFRFFIICYFSFICIFHYNVQLDYIDSWRRQKVVWNKIDKILPPAHKNGVIVFYDCEFDYKYTIRNAHLLKPIFPQIYGSETNIQFIRLKYNLKKYSINKVNNEYYIDERENEGYHYSISNTKINIDNIYYLKINKMQYKKKLTLDKLGINMGRFVILPEQVIPSQHKKKSTKFTSYLTSRSFLKNSK